MSSIDNAHRRTEFTTQLVDLLVKFDLTVFIH